MSMLNKLDGLKTYIIALLIGLVAAAQFLGWLDTETAAGLMMLLTGGGLTTLRHAVEKIETKKKK